MRRKFSPKFHVKNGVKNRKFHANFTLPGRSADGTVTLCTLRAATVLSRHCRADFGRRLIKKVMSHSRDGPGVTTPLLTNTVPLTGVWHPPPSVTNPLRMSGCTKSPGFRAFPCIFLGTLTRRQNLPCSAQICQIKFLGGPNLTLTLTLNSN